MFSHTVVGVKDFERALAFYTPFMASLGLELRFCEREHPWAGWQPAGGGRPLFLISRPFNGAAHDAGNGQMVAFSVDNRAAVHAAYDTALAHGGRCEGPPGPRPQYHANYYGAYLRDTEGNKLGIACHVPG